MCGRVESFPGHRYLALNANEQYSKGEQERPGCPPLIDSGLLLISPAMAMDFVRHEPEPQGGPFVSGG